MNKDKEYFAFISYKREDEKWAKWLAHQLDNYKLPSTLNGKELPPSLRKTFRDVDELSAGNLPEQIYNALSTSDNLIVICSPRSAKSEWVNKEIEDFINSKSGNTDHIFPFIIDGIPYSNDPNIECFPDKLRNLPEKEERLGGNINEQGGRNAAVVKVIAGMLGVSFDSLWNKYEREQKRKRWLGICIAMIVALVGIGIGWYYILQNKIIESQKLSLESATIRLREDSVTLAKHISRIQNDSIRLSIQNDSIILQNELILQQKNDLNISNKNLKSSNIRLKIERDRALTAQSRAMAEKSIQVGNNGDIIESMYLALQSLPQKISNPNRPIVPEAEFALRTAMNKWLDKGVHRYYMSNSPGSPTAMTISENNYVAYETSRGVYLENIATNKYKVNILKRNYALERNDAVLKMKFDNNCDLLYIKTKDSLYVWNLTNKNMENSYYSPCEYGIVDINLSDLSFATYEYSVGKPKTELITIRNNKGILIDSIRIPCQNRTYTKTIEYNPQGTKLAFSSDTILYVYNIKKRSFDRKVCINCYNIEDLHWNRNGDRLLVSANIQDSIFGQALNSSSIYELEVESGKKLLVIRQNHSPIVSSNYSLDQKYIISLFPKEFVIYDSKTGNVCELYENNEEQFMSIAMANSIILTSSLKNMGIQRWVWNKENLNKSDSIYLGVKGVKSIYPSNDFLYFAPLVRDTAQGINSIPLLFKPWMDKKEYADMSTATIATIRNGFYSGEYIIAKFSSHNKYFATIRDSIIFVVDLDSLTLKEIKGPASVTQIEFNPTEEEITYITDSTITFFNMLTQKDSQKQLMMKLKDIKYSSKGNKLYMLADSTLCVMEKTTRKIIDRINLHSDSFKNLCIDKDGKFAIVCGYFGNLQLWDLSTRSCKWATKLGSHLIDYIELSNDAQYIICGYYLDNYFSIIDKKTGVLIQEFRNSGSKVGHFNESGDKILTSTESNGGYLLLNNFYKLQDLIDSCKELCRYFDLSEEQKKRYFIK